MTTRTAARRLEVGDFSRQEMLLFAEKCNLDIYDFIRCFFTKMLREEETQKYVLKEVLVRMLVDSDDGKEAL